MWCVFFSCISYIYSVYTRPNDEYVYENSVSCAVHVFMCYDDDDDNGNGDGVGDDDGDGYHRCLSLCGVRLPIVVVAAVVWWNEAFGV